MAQGLGVRAIVLEIANNRPAGSPVRRFLATPVGEWLMNHQLVTVLTGVGSSGAVGTVGHRVH